jgi:hypothetical protein
MCLVLFLLCIIADQSAFGIYRDASREGDVEDVLRHCWQSEYSLVESGYSSEVDTVLSLGSVCTPPL